MIEENLKYAPDVNNWVSAKPCPNCPLSSCPGPCEHWAGWLKTMPDAGISISTRDLFPAQMGSEVTPKGEPK